MKKIKVLWIWSQKYCLLLKACLHWWSFPDQNIHNYALRLWLTYMPRPHYTNNVFPILSKVGCRNFCHGCIQTVCMNMLKIWSTSTGKPYWRGRLSTVDLLIKVVSFVKKVNIILNLNMGWSRIVSTRRSIVLSFTPSMRVPWFLI